MESSKKAAVLGRIPLLLRSSFTMFFANLSAVERLRIYSKVRKQYLREREVNIVSAFYSYFDKYSVLAFPSFEFRMFKPNDGFFGCTNLTI